MANFNFKLPDIGEGVAEGEIVEWHVAVGDVVAEDDPMVEVMTDKATVTIGAPRAGTIAELRFGVGEVAQVGEVIVTIDEAGASSTAASKTTADKTTAKQAEAQAQPEQPTAQDMPAPKSVSKDQGPAATAVGDIREGLPGSNYFESGETRPGRAVKIDKPAEKRASNGSGPIDFFQDKPLATPATRKLARDLGVDLRRISPTGPAGRTTRDDVKSFAEIDTSTVPTQRHAQPSAPRQAPQPIAREEREERKPFVGVRRKIAQRMQTTKNTAAHFTFVEECDVTELIALRARLRDAASDTGVKLSYLPFIVKAVVAALKKHPVLNSALDETSNELVYRRYYHIGIAAATPSGLMVPVVKNADQLTLLELAKEIDRLGDGAREGTLDSSELSGSTFTITSLGKQGGLFATPILNHPEVGILGVHQMKQKPVVRDGKIVIGDVMLLSLSFDHRIVDGHVGAAFAYDIIEYLEQPDRLFLEMV